MALLHISDPPFHPSIPLATLTIIAVWAFLRLWRIFFKNPSYPPGPVERNFLLGNWDDIPTVKPWATYAQWGKVYGDVVHFRLYRQHTIILNSIEAVDDLLEKRSNIYSSRSQIEMVNLMGWDFATGIKPYGPQWRNHRRFFQYVFRSAVSQSLRPVLSKKVNDLLYNLLLTPENFIGHYKSLGAANIMAAVYAYDIAPTNDYFVSLSENATARVSLSLAPGPSAVNAFPILKYLPEWFPGAGFHKLANETRELTEEMQELPFRHTKKMMDSGNSPLCIASELMERFNSSEEDIETIKEVCASSYAGGADTTAASLGMFFMAMATHPEIQKKAQREIDNVVGNGRLVTWDDMQLLPYIDALNRELMRWRPALPLGIAHCTTQDDVYKGYFIPKGTIPTNGIFHRAISRDERKFKDPDQFNPDRHFDEHGNLKNDYQSYAFGFGRRYG
ncbi:Cytochrome P450 monooxygenase COX2 [Psilocybe cubensis]|uniref:Cytochrome P450 monooxygenase COX2 n=1 Tax=Psilocybe cubensis TaxID=181762 RepID=A0ACB8GX67_PSICU|nr:Cytochrome P450 monooxygenase COX2 [Psilocybe cubensis]KAH9480218.1 Cytochrome P450 monooxygenase COX2 [Psilocybe cubensis]